jgi:hypothetical protein
MKILAIIDVVTGANLEELRSELPNELRGSWELFSQGVLREAYATASPGRVVFVLEAEDHADAQKQLDSLPLVGKKILRVELVELRPFVNWSMLFARS